MGIVITYSEYYFVRSHCSVTLWYSEYKLCGTTSRLKKFYVSLRCCRVNCFFLKEGQHLFFLLLSWEKEGGIPVKGPPLQPHIMVIFSLQRQVLNQTVGIYSVSLRCDEKVSVKERAPRCKCFKWVRASCPVSNHSQNEIFLLESFLVICVRFSLCQG